MAWVTAPLDPEMAAIDGFRAVLAKLDTVIEANWQDAIDQAEPAFLHQFRIAVRRTRTVLGVAKGVIPADVREPTRRGFARLASVTGTPRDLDVCLLDWARTTEPLGAETAVALAPVREAIERRRAGARAELEQALRSDRTTALIDQWHAWLTEPVVRGDLPRRAGRPLGPLVAARIERAHDRLIDRGRQIAPGTPAERVHDLRKDAKKLRYLLECFGSLLPDAPRSRYVKRLKSFQDNLGTHQDVAVQTALLRDVAAELGAGASDDTMAAIDRLTRRLEQQQVAARAEFAERFAAYDSSATRRALGTMLGGINT